MRLLSIWFSSGERLTIIKLESFLIYKNGFQKRWAMAYERILNGSVSKELHNKVVKWFNQCKRQRNFVPWGKHLPKKGILWNNFIKRWDPLVPPDPWYVILVHKKVIFDPSGENNSSVYTTIHCTALQCICGRCPKKSPKSDFFYHSLYD